MAKDEILEKMKKTCILLMCIFCIFPTSAKQGWQHREDMRVVFPFADHCKEANELYDAVNAYLDYGDIESKKPSNPRFIRLYPEFQRTKWANHRVWFHWGFNGNCKSFRPLLNLINTNIEDGYLREEDLPLFWYELEKEISKRNKRMIDLAANFMGYGSGSSLSSQMRDQCNALVTILYDIHLLGDWSTEETSVIASKEYIYKELYEAIRKIAGDNEDNYPKATKLIKQLKNNESDINAFMDVLKQKFTPFLFGLKGGIYDYKKKFVQLGYPLKSSNFWETSFLHK